MEINSVIILSKAHVLGGSVMGGDPSVGMIKQNNQILYCTNLLAIEGAMMLGNPGVNSSLSIAAFAKKAMGKFQSAFYVALT